MITYSKFSQLRLSQFCAADELVELQDWEYEDRLWVGEAIGFSEWLRPIGSPEALCSLSINFKEFPEQAAAQVLRAIDLPLRHGMTANELRAALGEPAETLRFVTGQVTYEFLTCDPERYKVSCTVEDEAGLDLPWRDDRCLRVAGSQSGGPA